MAGWSREKRGVNLAGQVGAGLSNMFLSQIFRQASCSCDFATISQVAVADGEIKVKAKGGVENGVEKGVGAEEQEQANRGTCQVSLERVRVAGVGASAAQGCQVCVCWQDKHKVLLLLYASLQTHTDTVRDPHTHTDTSHTYTNTHTHT